MDTGTKFEILHSEGLGSVIIADTASHDDVAEVFHNERHTVNQTVEQALQTARLFVAAPELLDLVSLVLEHFDGSRPAKMWMETERLCRATLTKARGDHA